VALSALISLGSIASAETVVTQSIGTVSEFTPNSLIIRSDVATAPTRYVIGRDISYVDETGAPVSVETVRSGLPVTVDYVRDGDRVVARRVVVRRAAVVPAPSTTIVERERPIIVERERPVVVERERPVIVEKKVPVVVEKRVAPPVVEEKRTTTTTTIRE